jgi:(2R)-sulfolactate sulfo-lyase subunit alpha
MRKAVAHRFGDHVAVAVADLRPGEGVEVDFLDGSPPVRLEAREAVPLGHKIALTDVAEGEVVREYGEPIGRATRPIPAGAHVHTHNLRSLRWDFGGRR